MINKMHYCHLLLVLPNKISHTAALLLSDNNNGKYDNVVDVDVIDVVTTLVNIFSLNTAFNASLHLFFTGVYCVI